MIFYSAGNIDFCSVIFPEIWAVCPEKLGKKKKKNGQFVDINCITLE